jgi:L-alanine-DL-glutamate epimerase-like enolase superfamily enzyme
MLDESVTSLWRIEQAMDLGSCRRVRINLARVGGITPALAIHKACQRAEIPCVAGGGPHGPVAASATAALAGACGGALARESADWRTQPWLTTEHSGQGEKNAAGKLQLNLAATLCGPGPPVDEPALSEVAFEQATIR